MFKMLKYSFIFNILSLAENHPKCFFFNISDVVLKIITNKMQFYKQAVSALL